MSKFVRWAVGLLVLAIGVCRGQAIIETIAGNGTARTFSGDGGSAVNASLDLPGSVAVDAAGNVYVADTFSNRIRRVLQSTGVIDTVAGNGTPVFRGDGGPAVSASLPQPHSIAVDAAGNLYLADKFNQRIRRVVANTGVIETIAGNGSRGFSGDGGRAVNASLTDPTGVAVDTDGNLYFVDTFNHRVRRVALSTGVIDTVAGSGGPGFYGDGGLAVNARFSYPSSVAVDAFGNLYIADTGNYRVRRVVRSTGVVDTVAGTGTDGFSGDGGPAVKAKLLLSGGLAVDPIGILYIADFIHVRRVDLSSGVIETVAGNGIPAFSGDGGPPIRASLAYPGGIAVDADGDLYIADTVNNRVRRVRFPKFGFLPWTVRPNSLSFASVANATFTVDKAIQLSSSLQGLTFTATSGAPSVQLAVDDGYFENVIGFRQEVAEAFFLNRLTPASYPVTLRSVQLFFSGQSDGLKTGDSLNIVAGANPSGSAILDGISLATTASRVFAVGQLSTYDVTPITIMSGDFVVGFSAANPPEFYPVVVDSSPEQQRSYLSIDGTTFFPYLGAGNFGIRAIVASADPTSWLRVTPAAGVMPALLRVSANPAGLAAGTYFAEIRIRVPDKAPQTLGVTFVVSAAP